jgi:hypothetical protein
MKKCPVDVYEVHRFSLISRAHHISIGPSFWRKNGVRQKTEPQIICLCFCVYQLMRAGEWGGGVLGWFRNCVFMKVELAYSVYTTF